MSKHSRNTEQRTKEIPLGHHISVAIKEIPNHIMPEEMMIEIAKMDTPDLESLLIQDEWKFIRSNMEEDVPYAIVRRWKEQGIMK